MCHNIHSFCMSTIPVVSLTTIPQFIQEWVMKMAIGFPGEVLLQQTTILSVLGIPLPNIYWDSDGYAAFSGVVPWMKTKI